MVRPQTIQIFLPSGNPQGFRQAEITTRTVQVFDVPRSVLGEFLKLDQAHQVGLERVAVDRQEAIAPHHDDRQD